MTGLEAATAAWGWTAVQAALVAAVAFAIARVLGPRWPRLRYGLLTVALLKFAVPPLVASPVGLLPAPAGAGGAGGAGVPGWAVVLGAGYLVGSLAVAVRLGMEAAALGRLRARSRAVTGGPVAAEVERLARALGLRRRPAVLLSEVVDRPFVTGLFRPALILPRALPDRLSGDALRDVLGHELAHLARGHLPGNALRAALAVVWWPHPVYWLVAAAHRRAAEEWCDDEAMEVTGASAPGYARSLLAAATLAGARPGRPLSWACALARRPHALEPRIARLATARRRPARWVAALQGLALAILAVAALTGARAGSAASAPTEEPAVHLILPDGPARGAGDHAATHALRHGGH